MRTKQKRLLVAGVLALGLMAMLLWLGGVRMGHIRFLLLRFSEPAELSAQQTAELHAWLGGKAVHLQTVVAGSGFEDMQPLKAVIGDARIIALGETHMNRELMIGICFFTGEPDHSHPEVPTQEKSPSKSGNQCEIRILPVGGLGVHSWGESCLAHSG